MCGRFALISSAEELVDELKLDHALDLSPRYNIAPTQQVAVVVSSDGQSREMRWMGWGLIPSWAKDPTIGYKLINRLLARIAK